ncbi:hypothetical protein L5559_006042 [Pseudomonas aeruginosa]|nr:hypothetical protein [Pseudomonas aeruginosa]EKU2261340.1 hypothetical protein [Pseudomonas aeruginosa]EKU7770897.1 hypothetical protein [Pseudomonas aeruginosa]EKU7817445.1 hypothetical protein [Pseudomonas aeruginosa]EKW0514780.1 hypothetical protein [Pseudomonas aeruginosa]
MSRYQFLGINDDKSHCECCGKQGLKRVVWIEDTETNEIRHFGTTCAMSPAKGFMLDAAIKAEIRRLEQVQKSRMTRAHYAYRQKGGRCVANPDKPGYFVRENPELWLECLAAA